MKKLILSIALSVSVAMAMAQSVALEAAQEAMKKNDWPNAKKSIDEATAKETKNAAVYYTKAAIYQSIADDDKVASLASDGHDVAFENYKKYMSLEPKYQADVVKNNLMNLIIANFNKGINSYNAKSNADAIKYFDKIANIAAVDNGKLFNGDKLVDTINTQAQLYKGYAQYNDKNTAEAKKVFEAIADNPIVKDVDLYLRLISIYQVDNDQDKWIGTITRAKAAYPGNKDLRNEEINYYVLTDKQDKLAEKLEEAVKQEPNNAELQFSLGTTYDGIANPRGKAKPANADELNKKAIAAYEKAAVLDAKKGDYPYNAGVLYFNQGVDLNSKMNAVTKEPAKYNPLKKQRDDIFKIAEPYLVKAMGLYEGTGIKDADKLNYRNLLQALQEIYMATKADAKKAEITKKLSSF
jgi:hypothetical protein